MQTAENIPVRRLKMEKEFIALMFQIFERKKLILETKETVTVHVIVSTLESEPSERSNRRPEIALALPRNDRPSEKLQEANAIVSSANRPRELETWLMRSGLSPESGLGVSRTGIYTDFT